MKIALFIFLILYVLYLGKETETHLEIINSAQQNDDKVETPILFDMRYQHGRVFGETLAVVGHDVFENQFVYLRLPISVQTGDTVVLTGNQFQYPYSPRYTLIRVFVVIDAHEKGAADKLVGVLHCWLTDDRQHFQHLQRRIAVVF